MLQGCQVNILHAYLHRINGCTYLGLAIIPWIGQRFRYSEDKHTILMARIIVSCCVFLGRGRGGEWHWIRTWEGGGISIRICYKREWRAHRIY